jgi:chromosome segregation ATPase
MNRTNISEYFNIVVSNLFQVIYDHKKRIESLEEQNKTFENKLKVSESENQTCRENVQDLKNVELNLKQCSDKLESTQKRYEQSKSTIALSASESKNVEKSLQDCNDQKQIFQEQISKKQSDNLKYQKSLQECLENVKETEIQSQKALEEQRNLFTQSYEEKEQMKTRESEQRVREEQATFEMYKQITKMYNSIPDAGDLLINLLENFPSRQ